MMIETINIRQGAPQNKYIPKKAFKPVGKYKFSKTIKIYRDVK